MPDFGSLAITGNFIRSKRLQDSSTDYPQKLMTDFRFGSGGENERT